VVAPGAGARSARGACGLLRHAFKGMTYRLALQVGLLRPAQA